MRDFLPEGFQLRQGWFGRLVLQRKVSPMIVRHAGAEWIDATAQDVFAYYLAKAIAQPPNEGTSGRK